MVTYTIVDGVPKYLLYVHNYDLANTGFLSSLPYIFQFSVGVLACLTIDFLTQKGFSNLTLMRKIGVATAFIPG